MIWLKLRINYNNAKFFYSSNNSCSYNVSPQNYRSIILYHFLAFPHFSHHIAENVTNRFQNFLPQKALCRIIDCSEIDIPTVWMDECTVSVPQEYPKFFTRKELSTYWKSLLLTREDVIYPTVFFLVNISIKPQKSFKHLPNATIRSKWCVI